MANSVTWAQYLALRELIADAVDEAVEFNGGWPEGQSMTLAISPDLDAVVASFRPWWDDEILAERIGTDWNIETAVDLESAENIADLYFDLR